jgi:kinesin family protein 6/9
MGILEFVSNEHAGIIPRAISQIFEHVEGQDSVEVSVSLSFLQLYRETIQDLLSPASANGSTPSGNDENLAIREDPQRGFFVEGLQEFTVRNYREAGKTIFKLTVHYFDCFL